MHEKSLSNKDPEFLLREIRKIERGSSESRAISARSSLTCQSHTRRGLGKRQAERGAKVKDRTLARVAQQSRRAQGTFVSHFFLSFRM